MSTSIEEVRRLAVVAAAFTLLSAASAAAQAFLPGKGEGYASILFTNFYANRHLLPVEEVDAGEIDSNTLLFDVTYGLTGRVAISLGLPLVVSRYQGPLPHQPDNPKRLDDGNWHPTFQDVRFALRYNAIRRGSFAVTPFAGTAVPSHAYQHWAHAAAGFNLRQAHAGVSAATVLDAITPGLFVQGRYAFAAAERIAGVIPKRSNADIELGYFLSPDLRVFGLLAAQKAHSGIDIFRGQLPTLPLILQSNHDRIARDEYVNVGGGTSVALNDTLDVYASFVKQIAGRNGHKMNRALSIGLTWNFRRPSDNEALTTMHPPASPVAPSAAEQASPRKSLVRCLCQKG